MNMTLTKERKVPVSALNTCWSNNNGRNCVNYLQLFRFLLLTFSQCFANILNVPYDAIPAIVSESLYHQLVSMVKYWRIFGILMNLIIIVVSHDGEDDRQIC